MDGPELSGPSLAQRVAVEARDLFRLRDTLRAVSVLGCEFPLMQAPLGRGAAARLAAAVSRAGGLGTLGASWTEPPVLRAEVRRGVSLPLLAAGGIGDPASALAALAAGASGVVLGTRFVASDECDAHPSYKARLLASEGRDTVLTELFDVGWHAPHRVLRNSTYERWQAAGRPPPGQRPAEGGDVAAGVPRYAVNMPLAGTTGGGVCRSTGTSRPWMVGTIGAMTAKTLRRRSGRWPHSGARAHT